MSAPCLSASSTSTLDGSPSLASLAHSRPRSRAASSASRSAGSTFSAGVDLPLHVLGRVARLALEPLLGDGPVGAQEDDLGLVAAGQVQRELHRLGGGVGPVGPYGDRLDHLPCSFPVAARRPYATTRPGAPDARAAKHAARDLPPEGHTDRQRVQPPGLGRVSHNVLEDRARPVAGGELGAPPAHPVTGAVARSFGDDEALLGSALARGRPRRRWGAGARAPRAGRGTREALTDGAEAGRRRARGARRRPLRGRRRRCSSARSRAGSSCVNLAEDNERVRRLRARGRRERRLGARRGPAQIAARGVSADELADTLAPSELRLVLTAHPTEARRRTTIEKLARIFATLRDLDERRDEPHPFPQLAGHRAGAVGLGGRAHAWRSTSPTRSRAGWTTSPPRSRAWSRSSIASSTSAVAESYPGEPVAGPAAAHVRLVDGRRPRRQPERDAAGDRGRARRDARRVPGLPRRAGQRAGGPAVAVQPGHRRAGRAGGDGGDGRRAVPGAVGAARAPPSRGALPARVRAHARAAASHACGRRGRLRKARSSCSTICGWPSGRCSRRTGASSRRATCAT